jgi:hypothetical protein
MGPYRPLHLHGSSGPRRGRLHSQQNCAASVWRRAAGGGATLLCFGHFAGGRTNGVAYQTPRIPVVLRPSVRSVKIAGRTPPHHRLVGRSAISQDGGVGDPIPSSYYDITTS